MGAARRPYPRRPIAGVSSPAMYLLLAMLLAAPPAPAAREKTRVLVMDLSTQGVPQEVASIVGGILSTEVSASGRFTPVSMQDLRNIVALEGSREAIGCNVASCLADLASAMGSRYVVYGEIGKLGDTLILNLNLYDADAATSIARRTVRAASPDALPDVLPGAMQSLLGEVATESDLSPFVVTGAVVLGAGALVAAGSGVGAGVASAIVGTPGEDPATKQGALAAGQWLLGGVAAGALVAAAGGVLLGIGLAAPDE